MTSDINLVDYLLVGFGILFLPLYLVGLIPLGIFLWRLGDKWQKHNEQLDKELHEKYDMDYIRDDILEEMK